MTLLHHLLRRAAAPGFAASVHPTYLIQTFQSFARLNEVATIRALSPNLIHVVPSLIPTQLLAIVDVHRHTRAIDPQVLRLIINRINVQRRSTPLAHMSELMQVAHSAGFHGTVESFMDEFQSRIQTQSNVLSRDEITSYVLPVVVMLKKQCDVVEESVNENLIRIPDRRAYDIDEDDDEGERPNSSQQHTEFGPTSWSAIEWSLARMAPERHPALHRALVHLLHNRKNKPATTKRDSSDEAMWESGYGRTGSKQLGTALGGGWAWGNSSFNSLATSSVSKPLAVAVSKGLADPTVRTRLKKWFDETHEKVQGGSKTPRAVECALAIMLCAVGPQELRNHPSAVALRGQFISIITLAYTTHTHSTGFNASPWVLAASASLARWGVMGPALTREERTAAIDLMSEMTVKRSQWGEVNIPYREKQAERMAWRLFLSEKAS